MTIKNKEYSFLSSNGIDEIYSLVFMPTNARYRGYLQFLHDKYDHIDRYEEVMTFFATRGYVCIGHDYMGHGRSVKTGETPGHFLGEYPEIRLIDDTNHVFQLIQQDIPISTTKIQNSNSSDSAGQEKCPILHGLIGMGFGATIAKLAILKYPNVNMVVLCGDKGPDAFAKFISSYCKNRIRKDGDKAFLPILERRLEGKYNKFVDDSLNGIEWRTRDSKQIARITQDRLCSFHYTAGAYRAMFEMEKMCGSSSWFKAFPKYLALYIIAGGYDPVSNYTRNLMPMISKLKQNGTRNAFYKFYDDARHELFFEINRHQVLTDVLRFIQIVEEQQLKQSQAG